MSKTETMVGAAITVPVEISREELIDAVAARIMQGYGSSRGWTGDDYDDPSPPNQAVSLEGAVARLVDKRVRETMNEEIAALIRTRLEPAIETVLAEGFPQRNHYGEVSGPPQPFDATVRSMVQDELKGRNGACRGWARELFEKVWREQIEAALKGEIETIRAKVRAYVDEQLGGAVVKAMREAVGLR